MMLAVIRIRGRVKVRKEIEDTLDILKLSRKHRCILVNEDPVTLGMIQKVKDYVTWGNISKDMIKELIQKRGRIAGDKKVSEDFLKEKGIDGFDDLVEKLTSGKIKLKDVGIKPYFRLTPPSKGFKGSIKQHYPKGALGNRGEKINDLLKRMI
ncbi:MAG: 50S ribosomal protein L30 [Candidatus Aenigmarchaeota archaeon]|nr:50S ribosomal protein L30 [Candidatus Aenigmarchaeota archaeon]